MSVHRDGFSHMPWTVFAEKAQNELKTAAEETSAAQRGKGPELPETHVDDTHEVFIEVRNPVQILNQEELIKACGKTRLPSHLKSIPTLTVPKFDDASPCGVVPNEFEKVWCFQDPSNPYRSASIVHRFGVGLTKSHLSTQMWTGHAQSRFFAAVEEQANKFSADAILEAKTSLALLDEFLEERGLKGQPKARAKSTPRATSKARAADDDDDDEDDNDVASDASSSADGMARVGMSPRGEGVLKGCAADPKCSDSEDDEAFAKTVCGSPASTPVRGAKSAWGRGRSVDDMATSQCADSSWGGAQVDDDDDLAGAAR